MNSTHHDGSDRGFTLVELIVYCSLLVVVISVVAGLFIGGLTATNRVRTMTAATTSAQALVDSIETNVRNSSGFTVATPSGTTDQFLVARTAKRDATLTWQCVAWYYSSAGEGSIRFKQSGAAITAPNSTDLTSWTLMKQGITPRSGSTIFEVNGQQLAITFNSRVSGYRPVVISGSAISRAGISGTPTCY